LIRAKGDGAKVLPPEKQRLVSKKEDLEAKIDRLKYEKAAMDENDYKQQLTALLLELARTQAEIDK
jgi:cell division protein FtsL